MINNLQSTVFRDVKELTSLLKQHIEDIVYTETAILFFLGMPRKLVVKLNKGEVLTDNKGDTIYSFLSGINIPKYVKMGKSYTREILLDGEKFTILSYQYESSSNRKIDLKDQYSLAKALYNIHSIENPNKTSIFEQRLYRSENEMIFKELAHLSGLHMLKNKFYSKDFLSGQSLLHGDLRLNNILLDPLVIIDFEDAVWGPIEWDIGRYLQSLFTSEIQNDTLIARHFIRAYEFISSKKINFNYVFCSMLLRMSNRIREDEISLAEPIVDSFTQKCRQFYHEGSRF